MDKPRHFHIAVADSAGNVTGYAEYSIDQLDTCLHHFMNLSKTLAESDLGNHADAFRDLKNETTRQMNFFVQSTGRLFSVGLLDCYPEKGACRVCNLN